MYVDIIWHFDWENVPTPVQAFITARAAAIVSSRIIGDGNQYQMLQQKEAFARSMALEYECNQGDYTFFGSPQGQTIIKAINLITHCTDNASSNTTCTELSRWCLTTK